MEGINKMNKFNNIMNIVVGILKKIQSVINNFINKIKNTNK